MTIAVMRRSGGFLSAPADVHNLKLSLKSTDSCCVDKDGLWPGQHKNKGEKGNQSQGKCEKVLELAGFYVQ